MTKIEWTDETWNPITGCSPISEGCDNCYAKRMSNRLRGRCGYDADEPFKVTMHHDKIGHPLKWRKPRRVFVCSMGDLFHDDVARGTQRAIFEMIGRCPQHTFQILTKRPQRMRDFVDWTIRERITWREGVTGRLPSNVWLGVTAENQERADERIPLLLQTPAAVRFVSVEPMLGPVGLFNSSAIYRERRCGRDPRLLDWVICGAETGHGARLMDPDWATDLRDQCQAADVPFFFKKWSTGIPGGEMTQEFPKVTK